MVAVRVLLVTFLMTLVSFAVSLLLGILGLVAYSRMHNVSPNMTLAYRYVAIPSAAAVGVMVLIFTVGLELRHYRQAKALSEIERSI